MYLSLGVPYFLTTTPWRDKKKNYIQTPKRHYSYCFNNNSQKDETNKNTSKRPNVATHSVSTTTAWRGTKKLYIQMPKRHYSQCFSINSLKDANNNNTFKHPNVAIHSVSTTTAWRDTRKNLHLNAQTSLFTRFQQQQPEGTKERNYIQTPKRNYSYCFNNNSQKDETNKNTSKRPNVATHSVSTTSFGIVSKHFWNE